MIKDTFVTTGYAALDRLVDDFITPKLILVTHNNKKEFLSDITTFVSVSAKIPTAIFSLELKKEDVIHNLIYSLYFHLRNINKQRVKLVFGVSALSKFFRGNFFGR